jgi:hypothetical protein
MRQHLSMVALLPPLQFECFEEACRRSLLDRKAALLQRLHDSVGVRSCTNVRLLWRGVSCRSAEQRFLATAEDQDHAPPSRKRKRPAEAPCLYVSCSCAGVPPSPPANGGRVTRRDVELPMLLIAADAARRSSIPATTARQRSSGGPTPSGAACGARTRVSAAARPLPACSAPTTRSSAQRRDGHYMTALALLRRADTRARDALRVAHLRRSRVATGPRAAVLRGGRRAGPSVQPRQQAPGSAWCTRSRLPPAARTGAALTEAADIQR